MFRRCPWSALFTVGLLAAALPAQPGFAGDIDVQCLTGSAVLYATVDLRIACTADRQGRPAILLTNLDASGDRLSPAAPDPIPAIAPSAPRAEAPAPPSRPDPEPAPRDDRPETVAIVLQNGDGTEEERKVEVRRREGDGATIVINIDNRQSPPPAPPPASPAVPAPSPWSWPTMVWGGIPGPYVFPEHWHFLGLTHDNSYPRSFGGLGFGTSRYAALYSTPEKPCAAGDCPAK
jgi:hypothetical protein